MAVQEKAIGRESVAAPPPPGKGSRFPAALALPLLGLAVYLTLYMSGLWQFGRIELAPRVYYWGPVPFLAMVTIIGFSMWWYGAARPRAALAGAAVLFVLVSLVAVGQSAASQQLIESVPRDLLSPALTAVSITASVLSSSALMLVAVMVAPALHREPYWVIAVILWPVAGYLLFRAVPLVMVMAQWQVDRPIIPHLYFGALLAKQCIIFGCIGYWLDDIDPGSPQSPGKTIPPYSPA